MQEGQASATAEGMAAIRALETRRGRDTAVTYDPQAKWFLGTKWSLIAGIGATGLGQSLVTAYCDFQYPGLVGWVICRHRQIDEWLLQCAAEGLEQIVVVGAGYDTRFDRYKEHFGDAQLFEVDHPATRARKSDVERAEEALALDPLVEELLGEAERLVIG